MSRNPGRSKKKKKKKKIEKKRKYKKQWNGKTLVSDVPNELIHYSKSSYIKLLVSTNPLKCTSF